MRAQRLAIVLDSYASGRMPLTPSEKLILNQLAERQVTWLCMPGNLEMMNHGYFQILGLELMCRVASDQPWAARGTALAAELFDKLVFCQFTDEGVHVENSPSYHAYSLKRLRGSGLLEVLGSEKHREIIERSAKILPWFTSPDGEYAEIGDSEGGGEPLSDPGSNVLEVDNRIFAVSPFWRSGYVIVRSMPDVPKERASMLILIGASHSHTHNHADKLSFELFEFGQRIIIDTGKYGYEKNEFRSYVQSIAAHNTVGIQSEAIKHTDVALGSAKLAEPIVFDASVVLEGEMNWPDRRHYFRHNRKMIYCPARSLLVKDTLKSERTHHYVSRLHFDRDLRVSSVGGEIIVEGKNVRARVKLLESDCELTLRCGEMAPIRGWQSVGYLRLHPTTMVEALGVGRERTITWSLVFEER